MSKRAILILGASIHQLPVIMAARAQGLHVITSDNVPSNPGHAYAHVSHSIDTTDQRAILQLSSEAHVQGVVAACTDVAVLTAAAVSAELGLEGCSVDCARILTDKLLFRAFMARHGLPTPHAITPPSWEVCSATLGLPFMLKPARSSGSKGIFAVRSEEDWRRFYPETLAFCPDGRALSERHLAGLQGTVELLLNDGEISWSMVTERVTASLPYVSTRGHFVPSPFSDDVITSLLRQIELVCSLLELKQGPVDVDFVIHHEQPYILEMTPRLGGNSLSSLARLCYGLDLPDLVVRAAMGERLRPSPTPLRPGAALLFGVEEAGALRYDTSAVEQLAALPWVEMLSLRALPGASVQPFIHGRHCLGEALISAESRGQLTERAALVNKSLDLHAV